MGLRLIRLTPAPLSRVKDLGVRRGRRRTIKSEPVLPRSLRPAVGRNDPCPCGSGKKYKHCCRGRSHV